MSPKSRDTSPDLTVKGLKTGFVGTREGMTSLQKHTFRLIVRDLRPVEIHHRDTKGADEDACFCIRLSGMSVTLVGHPPDSETHRAFFNNDKTEEPVPYPECSRAIVDDTNYLIAAPPHMYKTNGGAWFIINYARKMKKPRIIIWPNGVVDYYDVPGMRN